MSMMDSQHCTTESLTNDVERSETKERTLCGPSPTPTSVLLHQDPPESAPVHELVPAPPASSTSINTAGDRHWKQLFRRLQIYAKQHGNCLVDDKELPSLAAWLKKQERLFRNGSLHSSKRKQLQSLGVEWNNMQDVQPVSYTHLTLPTKA